MQHLSITQLNTKAMTVQLSISKPATSRRDHGAEVFTQQSLADAGLKVSATLFKERTSPVRQLLNSANAPYVYHKANTLPYIDRGPRLLPVIKYEPYRDEMRKLITEVQSDLQRVMPDYDQHVLDDIKSRGARASVADYPSAREFEDSFRLAFTFAPLPDQSHFLFDVSPEDRAALDNQLGEIAEAARQDMRQRLADPMRHLLAKLRIPAGEPGSVFRDTAVENVFEAVEMVRSLAMGDEDVLSMCDEVAASMAGYASNPQILRDSPIVRERTVAKLDAVASRMAFMFGA